MGNRQGGGDGVAALSSLDDVGLGVTLLGGVGLAGEEDEALLVGLEAGDVGMARDSSLRFCRRKSTEIPMVRSLGLVQIPASCRSLLEFTRPCEMYKRKSLMFATRQSRPNLILVSGGLSIAEIAAIQ